MWHNKSSRVLMVLDLDIYTLGLFGLIWHGEELHEIIYCRAREHEPKPVISPAPKLSIYGHKQVLKAFSCDCGSRGGIRWSNAPWQMSVCRAEGRGTVLRAQCHHSLSSQYQLVLHDSNQCGGAKHFHHPRLWPVAIHAHMYRWRKKKQLYTHKHTVSVK